MNDWTMARERNKSFAYRICIPSNELALNRGKLIRFIFYRRFEGLMGR